MGCNIGKLFSERVLMMCDNGELDQQQLDNGEQPRGKKKKAQLLDRFFNVKPELFLANFTPRLPTRFFTDISLFALAQDKGNWNMVFYHFLLVQRFFSRAYTCWKLKPGH